MTVLKTTGTKATKFSNQAFFQDFNWSNFQPGDTVWLEDYTGTEPARIVGLYTGTDEANNPIVRLIPNQHGQTLARLEVENISQMVSNWWQKFLA